jgi:ubiquitin C-terminal hydrolase
MMVSEGRFSANQEQDCHEFLLYLLNNLKEELNEKGAKPPEKAGQGI